jgi:hypothetical protein
MKDLEKGLGKNGLQGILEKCIKNLKNTLTNQLI